MRRLSTLLLFGSLPFAVPALNAQSTIFLDGFEVGSVCLWSSSSPSFPCGEYQTCAKAEGDVWACFEEPFEAPPSPTQDDGISGPHGTDAADVYLLVDRSGSMLVEAAALRDNLAAVVSAVRCPPLGTGTLGACYPDLWVGAGNVGYHGANGANYSHRADLQPDAVAVANSILTAEPAGCCEEATSLAVWATASGSGSAASGCTTNAFPPRATCVGSPAEKAGFETFGYPCFREGALSFAVAIADEGFATGCPSLPNVVIPTAINAGVRVPGIQSAPAAAPDLQTLAVGTGAVDPANGNAPLVFLGPETLAPQALQTALLTARSLLPVADIAATLVDGSGDPVDVTEEFLERVEALDGGDPACATGLTRVDGDGDGFFDTFLAVPVGSTLCWRVVARQNDGVPESATTQNYPGSLLLSVDGSATVALPLLFLVPPG